METSYDGRVPIIDYLKRLSIKNNDYYVETKNSILRTEHDLNLLDEEPEDPNSVRITDLKRALNDVGFDDNEDLNHISCLTWLKQNRGYAPIFATADRALYECKDIIYEHTGVIVEDPLYAAITWIAWQKLDR